MTATADVEVSSAHHAGRRHLLGSGWLPLLVAWALVAVLLVATGVSPFDVLVFSGYLVTCLVLPGTLMWRALAGDRPRPFVSDLVLGTGLAYAVELFWYLLVRAAGVPLLVLAWPALVVGASLHSRWRSRLWRPREVQRMSPGWSWSMAAIVVFSFAYVARALWQTSPLDGPGNRFPYVDEPYHLSLVAELRHQFPVASPVVDGEPLYYHWFLHAEVAASSWATGIEPVVLLQRLSLVPMIVVVLVGAAVLAGRLAGSATLGLVAPASITIAGSAQLTSHFGDPFLATHLYLSPTTTFAQMLLVPILALVLTLLDHDLPARWWTWVASGVVLAAVSAAKATVLPFVAAGLLGVVLLAALLERRLDRRALGLFALSVAVFLVVQNLVFGSQSRGLRWDPLALSVANSRLFVSDGEDIGIGTEIVLMIVFLGQQLAYAAGIVGLARRGLWRDPRAQFLVLAATAGVGATFAFAANGSSQLYFFRTTPLVFAVASTWGLSVLLQRPGSSRPRVVLLAAALSGAVVALIVGALDANGVIGLEARNNLQGLLEPYLLGVLGVVLVVAALRAVLRSRGVGQSVVVPAAVVAVMGLGLPTATTLAADFTRDPLPSAVPEATERATIGVGGIAAARWLRSHSDADDLVATNGHCRAGSLRGRCDNRMFWLSAYSERRILLEGWSYQVRTAPLARELQMPGCCLPFWHPDLLAANDAAFRPRSESDLDALRERGVDWLVVDLRAPHNLDRLERFTEVAFERGEYVVLSLR